MDATTQASASDPEGVPSQTVVVQWGGGICDRAATVHISPSVQAIEIVPAPSPPCDTLYDQPNRVGVLIACTPYCPSMGIMNDRTTSLWWKYS